MSEKRKFMRFNILLEAVCKRGASNKKLKINNFSREGLGIVSAEALSVGDEVDLELNIPGDNMPIMVKGEVTWTLGPSQENRQHKSGLRFKDIHNSDRSRILGYIYQKWIMPANIA